MRDPSLYSDEVNTCLTSLSGMHFFWVPNRFPTLFFGTRANATEKKFNGNKKLDRNNEKTKFNEFDIVFYFYESSRSKNCPNPEIVPRFYTGLAFFSFLKIEQWKNINK